MAPIFAGIHPKMALAASNVSSGALVGLPILCLLIFVLSLSGLEQAKAQPFFIGGYGDGIYLSRLAADGGISPAVLLAEQKNPSFFCLHPSLDVLYVITETMRGDMEHPASVAAYRFDREAIESGQAPRLSALNSRHVDGDIPCHITIDSQGRLLVIANYINGSVVTFRIAPDGSIGDQGSNIVHQLVDGKKASNGHCSQIAPGDQWVLVADLGLDRVFVYALEPETGKLTPSSHPYLRLPDGSGPRHLSFHPDGNTVYIINESNMTMSSARWDSSAGRLSLINTTSTLPPETEAAGFSTAEVLVHPNGRFVFGSNRGHDTIVTMQIDQQSGSIDRLGNTPTLGRTPRNFRISPCGKFLLAENQSTDNIFSFSIDLESGKLRATGHSITVPSPACIRFIDR
jgi:6-phosphogluconolactonase